MGGSQILKKQTEMLEMQGNEALVACERLQMLGNEARVSYGRVKMLGNEAVERHFRHYRTTISRLSP